MDNIYDMTQQELHNRAFDKAYSKLMHADIEIVKLRQDIERRSFGSLSESQVESMLNSTRIDQKVWRYISELIEKNDKL
jgi:hypothetical protein